MSRLAMGSVVGSIVLLGSCTPAGQSSADSARAAASSTPVGVGAAIPDSAALVAATKISPTPASSAAKSSSKPAGTTTKPQSKAPIVEDDIIGKDSVIKDRFRVVPRPSSTPTR